MSKGGIPTILYILNRWHLYCDYEIPLHTAYTPTYLLKLKQYSKPSVYQPFSISDTKNLIRFLRQITYLFHYKKKKKKL